MAAKDQRSPTTVLRRALDDFEVDDRELERRLEWPAGELARVLGAAEDRANEDPTPYQRVWIALLILALERWADREQGGRPYPFDSSTSYVGESAGEYEAFETDDDPAAEVGLTSVGPPGLDQASLVMSRELTGIFLDLMNRLYQAGGGEEAEPFDQFVQTIWQLLEKRD